MKALITGAGGFVGPHLVDHLRDSGDEVVPVDLDNGPDLRDREGWGDTIAGVGPEVVYHLGGWSDVAASWHDPYTTFEVNVLGAVSVLDGAKQAGCRRVILVSSSDVYGAVPADQLPITENHPVTPSSPYGASKQAVEAVAMQYHRGYGLDVVVVRPFNHLGPGQSPRFAAPGFASQIAAAEAADPDGPLAPLLHGDLSPKRDLTDVRDVVRAYRLLAESGRAGTCYNVCSGRSISMAEVLETLCSLSTASVTTEVDPARLRSVDVMMQRGSPAKLTEATGWQPTIALDQTLRDVLDDARRRHRSAAKPADPTGGPDAPSADRRGGPDAGLRAGDPAIG